MTQNHGGFITESIIPILGSTGGEDEVQTDRYGAPILGNICLFYNSSLQYWLKMKKS